MDSPVPIVAQRTAERIDSGMSGHCRSSDPKSTMRWNTCPKSGSGNKPTVGNGSARMGGGTEPVGGSGRAGYGTTGPAYRRPSTYGQPFGAQPRRPYVCCAITGAGAPVRGQAW